MRYVLTGASGHIGNNLVRMINQKYPDAEVVVITRRKIERELCGTCCTQVVGNLEDADFFYNNIKAGDIVVHAAGLIDLTDKKQDEMYRVNYLMTKNICDAARQKRAGKFVYIGSTDAIYIDKNSGDIVTEPDDYYPEKMKTGYARTKAMASKYVLEAIREHDDFNAGIIMPTAVIGINDYRPSEAGKIIKNTLRGGAQFAIKGGYNFVDVEDVCEAIIALCMSHRRDSYIISGSRRTVKELYEEIDKYKGLKKRPMILPTFVAYLACPFVKTLSPVMIRVLQEAYGYSCKKAQNDLDFSPRPFDETLRNTTDWHDFSSK